MWRVRIESMLRTRTVRRRTRSVIRGVRVQIQRCIAAVVPPYRPTRSRTSVLTDPSPTPHRRSRLYVDLPSSVLGTTHFRASGGLRALQWA